MKSFFFTWFVLATIASNAQIGATTDNGKRVILNNDNTWKYDTSKKLKSDTVVFNRTAFSKSQSSTSVLQSKKIKVALWYNADVWKIPSESYSESAEFSLLDKEEEGFLMIINEKVQLTYDLLKEAALKNAQNLDKNAFIEKEEYRMVNGIKVLHVILDAETSGVGFKFFSYYYTGKEGTVQIVAYTSANIFAEKKKEFEDVLNGFTISN